MSSIDRKSKQKDAITLLMEDHQRVRKLFNELIGLRASRFTDDVEHRQELMAAVCAELKMHMRLEEEFLFPAVRELLEHGDHLAAHAGLEHGTAKFLIAMIESADYSDAQCACHFKALGDCIATHVREEETSLFAGIRKSGLDLVELGARMARRKEQLVFELAEQQFDVAPSRPQAPSFWARVRRLGDVAAGRVAMRQ